MTPKQKLLDAIEVAMLLGQCRVTSNMLRLLNEQLGKIKSLANDIEEENNASLDHRIPS